MLLAEPSHTPYDLKFSVLGIPVRVHPLFFLMPLVLGGALVQGDTIPQTLLNLLVLSGVFLGSILVHELGHSLAMRYYGESSHIVLYWLGGLAISDIGRWSSSRARPRTPWSQIMISAAGPGAGFLLGFLLIGILLALGGRVAWIPILLFPLPMPNLLGTRFASNEALHVFLAAGLFSCFFWNLLNLAPIWPLDGGKISQALFSIYDPWNGVRNSLLLSIAAAVGLAIWSLSGGSDGFGTFFFFYLAFESYMMLQQTGGGFGGRPW